MEYIYYDDYVDVNVHKDSCAVDGCVSILKFAFVGGCGEESLPPTRPNLNPPRPLSFKIFCLNLNQ